MRHSAILMIRSAGIDAQLDGFFARSRPLILADRRFLLGFFDQRLKIRPIANRVKIGVGPEDVEIKETSSDGTTKHINGSVAIASAAELVILAQL